MIVEQQVKEQIANGKTVRQSAIIPDSHPWGVTFAFCDLLFDLLFHTRGRVIS
jgi:hypothetical protein